MKLLSLLLFVLTNTLMFSCSRIPLTRTLPFDIKNVYIPMFENKTQEYGLEELGTNYTIEEILSDGRLNVVTKENSDIWLEVIIVSYTDKPQTFDSDEFNIVNGIDAAADVKVWQPGKSEPIAEFKSKARYSYLADTRYSTAELPIDAKDNLMRELAVKITQDLMTGKYK